LQQFATRHKTICGGPAATFGREPDRPRWPAQELISTPRVCGFYDTGRMLQSKTAIKALELWQISAIMGLKRIVGFAG
jgi:aminoglycoside phosphotransferase